MKGVEISPDEIAAMVRERIAAALPDHVLRGISRQILRKQLGVVSLATAARILGGWKDLESLRVALKRSGIAKVEMSDRKVGYLVDDAIVNGKLFKGLASFRNAALERGAGGHRLRVVKEKAVA